MKRGRTYRFLCEKLTCACPPGLCVSLSSSFPALKPPASSRASRPRPKPADSSPHFAEDKPNDKEAEANSTAYAEKITELEREVRNLTILNDTKEKVIEHLSDLSKNISAHFAEQMTAQARVLSTSFKADVKRLGRLEERLQIEERVGEPIINANHTNPNDA